MNNTIYAISPGTLTFETTILVAEMKVGTIVEGTSLMNILKKPTPLGVNVAPTAEEGFRKTVF